jgi:polar amino acid transport system substrate-binding protein
MSSRFNKTARSLSIAAFVLGAVLTHRAEASPAIKVCVDHANPISKVDARVVRAAAQTQGYSVEEVAFVGHGKEEDDGFPVARFAKLAQSECQLIIGFPVDISGPHLPPNVHATPAYASTGFVLVERGSAAPMPLSELPKGSEVGIAQLDTWAGLLYTANPNIVMHVYHDDAHMLADLEHHQIAAALTWQSFLAGYENVHSDRKRLSSSVLPGSHMVWNLVALYAAESQDAADIFTKGVDALRSNGKLEQLIKPYQTASVVGGQSSSAVMRLAAPRQTVAPNQRCGASVKGAKTNAKKGKRPALYTEAQATQGAIHYFQNCGMCHGPLLDGQRGGYPGPALKGAAFADPSYDFHVDEIFRFVAKLMPAATPGSLSNEQNVDIMAFILKQNGYPAGTTELTYDGAMHSKVPIRYYGD